jgi:hypothetical protein
MTFSLSTGGTIGKVKNVISSCNNICIKMLSFSQNTLLLVLLLSHVKWLGTGFGSVIGFVAQLQLGTTSNYNTAHITITHISLLGLLQRPLVVAWLQSSNRVCSSRPYCTELHSLTADSRLYRYAHGFLVTAQDKTSFLRLTARQSRSYFTTRSLPPISSSWRQASWDSRPEFFFFATEPLQS